LLALDEICDKGVILEVDRRCRNKHRHRHEEKKQASLNFTQLAILQFINLETQKSDQKSVL